MNYEISSYPNSYLKLWLNKGESFITEKGVFVYSSGAYDFKNKIEARSYQNWIAKLLGGKSISYNIYTAKEDIELWFAPKSYAEIFYIAIENTKPVIFNASIHFARTQSIDIKLQKRNWKSTLNEGLQLKTHGSGSLFLKGFGQILAKQIDTDSPIYIDENALIAYEDTLEVKTISKGLRETFTSGEGFLLELKGKGKIWMQTREGYATGAKGLLESAFDLFT